MTKQHDPLDKRAETCPGLGRARPRSPGSQCIALWAMSVFLFPYPFFLKGQERVGGGQRGVGHPQLRAHHELGGYRVMSLQLFSHLASTWC